MNVKEVIKIMENFAPPALAESYDNVGLMVGDSSMRVTGILLALDVVEETIDEAIDSGLNMIISHHPLIFKPIKSLTGRDYIERIIIKALKNDIAIYSAHTNADITRGGVSHILAKELGLKHLKVLRPIENNLVKLVVYTPFDYSNDVRKALADAGAGALGIYDSCSFSSIGEGRFRASDGSTPFVGSVDSVHTEKEEKIEVVVQKHMLSETITAVKRVHPYQEVVYEIFCLYNANNNIGLGICGELEEAMDLNDFFLMVKSRLSLEYIRYSKPNKTLIRTVALCGGSGGSMISDAVRSCADIYLTGDLKYHDYLSTDNNIIIADIGHFESEQFILNVFYDVLIKKITTFAVRKSANFINPMKTI